MTARLVFLLERMTFSDLEMPKDYHCLSRNLLRVSIWGALGSGSAALVSFIFSRSLVQEGSWKEFAPYVFKASLASCATFTLFAAFLSYRFRQMFITQATTESTTEERAAFVIKLNNQVVFLEAGLAVASSTASILANLVPSYLYPN